MLNKIKELVVGAYHKVKEELFNTIWEVKGWVMYLLGALMGMVIGKAVVTFATHAATFAVGLASLICIGLVVSLVVSVLLYIYGVADVRYRPNWRVVS